MIYTVQPGPQLCLWGDQGQCIVRVALTPEAALTIAGDLLNAASRAMRGADWQFSPDPLPNGNRSPFEHERDLAPCDTDTTN